MRRELKKRSIENVTVLYSKEEAQIPQQQCIGDNGKAIPGSLPYVPAVAGLMIAGAVIRQIAGGVDGI